MPVCRECEDEVDELVKVKVEGRTRKLCEECADRLREEMEIAVNRFRSALNGASIVFCHSR